MIEDKVTVAYQGTKGAYSYQACEEFFPNGIYRGYRHFFESFRAVTDGTADFAMIPLENSTAGRVMEVYNLLPESGLKIIGEHLLPIRHCLMIPHKAFRGTPPAALPKEEIDAWKASPLTQEETVQAYARIREVYSHPQAIAQCQKFLRANIDKSVSRNSFDTAGAARDIASREDAEIAAIASEAAAQVYNMTVLARNIEDCPGNTTRFLILSRDYVAKPPEGPGITTIIFETKHEPGALLKTLQVFQDENINMIKLETYMSGPAKPYPSFYVDVAASLRAKPLERALEKFKNHIQSMEILGSYPASPERGKDNGFLKVE